MLVLHPQLAISPAGSLPIECVAALVGRYGLIEGIMMVGRYGLVEGIMMVGRYGRV